MSPVGHGQGLLLGGRVSPQRLYRLHGGQSRLRHRSRSCDTGPAGGGVLLWSFIVGSMTQGGRPVLAEQLSQSSWPWTVGPGEAPPHPCDPCPAHVHSSQVPQAPHLLTVPAKHGMGGQTTPFPGATARRLHQGRCSGCPWPATALHRSYTSHCRGG